MTFCRQSDWLKSTSHSPNSHGLADEDVLRAVVVGSSVEGPSNDLAALELEMVNPFGLCDKASHKHCDVGLISCGVSKSLADYGAAVRRRSQFCVNLGCVRAFHRRHEKILTEAVWFVNRVKH